MPQAAHFPLYLPPRTVRPFTGEAVARRVARVAQLEVGVQVLSVGGAGGLPLVREPGVTLVVAEPDEVAADQTRQHVEAAGLGRRVQVERVDLERLPFPDGEFHAALLLGHVPLPFEQAVKRLRRVLVPSQGRLAITYPVRVGAQPAAEVLAFWRDRLGEPLRAPRELFMALDRAGFESEDGLTLTPAELEAVHAEAEAELERGGSEGLPAELLRQEMALHRSAAGAGAFSYALLVARRREPSEAPFTSRDRG
jgi:hypothetical protein